MLDLQSALNVGEGFFYESEQWMQDEVEGKRRELDGRPDWPISAVEPGRREACIIDPILGTSTKLVSVMVCPVNDDVNERQKQPDFISFPELQSRPESTSLRSSYREEVRYKPSSEKYH